MKSLIRTLFVLAVVSVPMQLGAHGFLRETHQEPKVQKMVVPSFPEGARDARASGTVKVVVRIDSTGSVVSSKSVEGHKLFSVISENAAAKWLFEPVEQDISREFEIIFVYTLLSNDAKNQQETTTFTTPNVVEVTRKQPTVMQNRSKT